MGAVMQITDSQTLSADSNEQVTFSVGATDQVIGVTGSVDAGPGAPLPITVTGHHQVAVAVGFTGNGGGSAEIKIAGSSGGATTDTINQSPGLPVRNRIYNT
jgi:hypothetical protein